SALVASFNEPLGGVPADSPAVLVCVEAAAFDVDPPEVATAIETAAITRIAVIAITPRCCPMSAGKSLRRAARRMGASLADEAQGMLREEMIDVVRTPEETLQGLPDFPFVSHYRTVEGLRLAHLDEGEGAPVIFFHGEPTWSFLWRRVIPPVRDAGFRCIAPDLAGFGRSDKPTDIDFYTYDRHVELAATLLEDLDVSGAT